MRGTAIGSKNSSNFLTISKMNDHTEYDLMPGVYRHYKGGMYVVTELVTHADNEDGLMVPLEDPIVCYRDLDGTQKMINGRRQIGHQVYSKKLSLFNGLNKDGAKRFVMV
ncbi:MAG: DUF1653 domain-containing protein [Cyclobacteriaceae bacterium]|nr:DUF1653 domain-containing protein [Cyclobacteriaceae bacterium]